MTRCTFALAIVLAVLSTSVVNADILTLQAGGDRLTALQNDDGGWDWPLIDGNSSSGSQTNTVSPIGLGLANAQAITNDASQLAAVQQAGSFLLNKTTFSPMDGIFAATLDSFFGGTTYSDYVKTNFYDALESGTYVHSNSNTYSTATFTQYVHNARHNSGTGNLAAWDIGLGIAGASAVGAETSGWISATKNEIDYLDSNNYFDVLGLAGAVYGLASVGEDFDPTAGEHAAATSINDLGAILASYQINDGGFAWNAGYVIANDDNEAIQETAYAMLALYALDRDAYMTDILGAADYIESVQFATGGWQNYAGSGENNEITGEALWAIATVPEPATLAILLLGATCLRRSR